VFILEFQPGYGTFFDRIDFEISMSEIVLPIFSRWSCDRALSPKHDISASTAVSLKLETPTVGTYH
jgi:hypothetical protein